MTSKIQWPLQDSTNHVTLKENQQYTVTENTNLGGTRPLSTIPSPISLTCNFPPFWSKMRCYRKQNNYITANYCTHTKPNATFPYKKPAQSNKNVMKTKKMMNKWSFLVTCRLMGMCCWMGSYFHNWIDYNGPAFLLELLEWDCDTTARIKL